MEDFLRSVLVDCVDKLEDQNDKITKYFDDVIRESQDDEATIEMLEKFKPVHGELVETLMEQMQLLNGLEIMGFGEDTYDAESKLITGDIVNHLNTMTLKVEIIVEFLVDSLGSEIVVEVLGLE